MTIQPHDFSRPSSVHPDTRTKLVQWVSRANVQFAESISAFGLESSIQFEECISVWPLDSLPDWSEKTLAVRVRLSDAGGLSVIAIPNPLAQVVIGAMLGEQLAEWPAERELTPAEESIGEFLISKAVDGLNCTWPYDSVLELKSFERETNLRRTRSFRFQEPLVVCRSTVKTPLGSSPWCWMLSQTLLSELFGSTRVTRLDPAVSTRQQLESIARELTTHVTIRLGSVQLSPPQLAQLQVGDLVVLNQKTNDPLRAMVSGKPRFLGWPGRIGTRQAFEIAADGPRLDPHEQDAESASVMANQLLTNHS